MNEPQDLFGVPLGSFVAERSALAKALRKAGQREQAQEVAALRKPSVAAWAVNQLVRTQGGAVAELFEAGDALQRAQAGLLARQGDGRSLREAIARERDAVDKLADKARGLLSEAGGELSPTTLERVSDTLHAAALDLDARALVKDGCLQHELRHIGLGSSPGLGTPSAPARVKSARSDGRAPGRHTGAERAQAERERAERRKVARQAEADARRGAERAERELRGAQARRDEAARRLEQAEEALATAHQSAERAVEAHRQAQAQLEAARG